jgi:hypothetical protein
MDGFGIFLCLVYGCAIGMVTGFFIGATVVNTHWQRDLIHRDLAYYDPKTGEFKFKEKGQ